MGVPANGDSDIHLVLARSEEGTKDGRGLSMFIYDNGTPFKFESGKITTVNLEVGRDVIKLGDVNISGWGATGDPIKGEAHE